MSKSIEFDTRVVYTVDEHTKDENTPTSTTFTFTTKNKKGKSLKTKAESFYLDFYEDAAYTKPRYASFDIKISTYDVGTGTGSGTIATNIGSHGSTWSIPRTEEGTYYIALRNQDYHIDNLRGVLEVKELKRKELFKLAGSPKNLIYTDNVEFRITKADGTEFAASDVDGIFKVTVGRTREDTLEESAIFNHTSATLSEDKKAVIFKDGSFASSLSETFTADYAGAAFARLWVKKDSDGSGSVRYSATEQVVEFNITKEEDLFDSTKSSFTINSPKLIYVQPKPVS